MWSANEYKLAREINPHLLNKDGREQQIKDRLRYNFECARKDFLFALKKTECLKKKGFRCWFW